MPSEPDRLDRALAALKQVVVQPAEAAAVAEKLVADEDGDEAAAVALRALGLAAREAGALRRADAHLRRAIRVAERVDKPYRAAEARMSLVVILSDRGLTDEALAEATLAAVILKGLDYARLQVNLGLVFARTGRGGQALAAFEESVPVLAAAGDSRFEALALNSRGIVYGMEGRYADAAADLARAEKLSSRDGYLLLNAIVQANMGWVARQTGDVPAALARLDAAAERFARHGKGNASLPIDRADTLLATGLAHEAREVVAASIADHRRNGFMYNLAESHLMHARAALADDDADAAAASAKTARTMFARQRRTAWADLARSVEVAARFAKGVRTAGLLNQAVDVADRLAAAGWQVAPHETRLMAGRIAVDLKRREEAGYLLAQVARHRSRGTAEIRTLAWHAHALHALSDGRIAAAEKALAAGLKVHAEYNAVLGATDLRAHAAGRGQELATLGLELALERRDARAVLRWAETWRAASLRRRPVRPPDDRQLADDLAELRWVTAQIATASTPARGTAPTAAEVSRLNTERLRLEAAVRDRSRWARGAYAPEPPFSPAALIAALGDRVLVEFVRVHDDLHAISVADGVVRRHRMGSYAAVLKQLDSVRFTMNRMSRRFGSPAIQAAAVQAYDHSRAQLDSLLFDAVRAVVGAAAAGRPLVIVPTGSLHALPWTALPTCAGRSVSVTPSARLWMAAAEGAKDGVEGVGGVGGVGGPAAMSGSIALVAGPGLDHAEPEIRALSGRYPEATVLIGAQATAAATAAALDGAHLAHVATHGRFRADHPLFSSLEACDGPLYVYDLERLTSTPQLLVLSACESALSGVRPGDELMGLASAVFSLGTRTLIASVTPVNDADTRTLMLELHEELNAGLTPAAALTEASGRTGIGGFVCFGYGG